MSYRRVVVGTDGSETAALAVEQAAEVAKSFDAELLIVTAFDPHPTKDTDHHEVPDDLKWQITDSALADGHTAKAGEIAARVGLTRGKVHMISERGDPSDAFDPRRRGARRGHDRGRLQGDELGQPVPARQRPQPGVPPCPLRCHDRQDGQLKLRTRDFHGRTPAREDVV